MLTYGYWQRRFGGDPSAIGKTLMVDGRLREVIGIMPQSFRFLNRDPALFLPLQFDRAEIHAAGFNFQALARLTGPGYYVAHADPALPEVLIDYRELPPAAPAGWPPLRRNEVGAARFVYGFMVDRLRRVSEHVTIGSAARHGRDLGSWFLLTREA